MSEQSGGREERSDYRSYLLRLWRVDELEGGWQASLESARTGVRRGFADLEALLAYLRQATGVPPSHAHNDDVNGACQKGKKGGSLPSI